MDNQWDKRSVGYGRALWLGCLFSPFIVMASVMAAEPISRIEQPVAFGLSWGMTAKQLERDGVSLDDQLYANANTRVYQVRDLPQALGDAKSYKIWLTPEHGLQRIAVVGEPIRNDATGNKAKQRYREIKQILIERFGDPVRTEEYSGRKKYTEFYQFNQCLQHEGCGKWASYFRAIDTSTLLQLRAIDRDQGYYELIFEGPAWNDDWLQREQEQLNVGSDP